MFFWRVSENISTGDTGTGLKLGSSARRLRRISPRRVSCCFFTALRQSRLQALARCGEMTEKKRRSALRSVFWVIVLLFQSQAAASEATFPPQDSGCFECAHATFRTAGRKHSVWHKGLLCIKRLLPLLKIDGCSIRWRRLHRDWSKSTAPLRGRRVFKASHKRRVFRGSCRCNVLWDTSGCIFLHLSKS